MKVTITISKRLIEEGKTVGAVVEEIVEENVARYIFDEGLQKILLFSNDGTCNPIDLNPGDGNKGEQWFLADIKSVQVPLKVEL